MGSGLVSEYTADISPTISRKITVTLMWGLFVGGRNLLAIFKLLREGRNIRMMEKITLRNYLICTLHYILKERSAQQTCTVVIKFQSSLLHQIC
jgi:hypothetical protein